MKKIIGVSLAIVFSAASFAQNEQIQNKNGVDMMPVSGEWGVGMNALPIFNYIGNAFNGNTNNTFMGGNKFVSYWSGQTLFGKYMLSDDNAIRAQLRIGQTNWTYNNYVYSDRANNPDSLVMDSYTNTTSNYSLGAGYEFRRGKNRLRGIYGGEAMYMFQRGTKTSYTYGNDYGIGNQSPTATEWFSWGGVIGENPVGERVVSQSGGNYNGLGVRGFIGVEYYVLPKICIGTEFGWGVMYGKSGESVTRTEFWAPTVDVPTGEKTWREVTTAGSSGWNIDTDNFGGSLYMMFYF
ncbi:MAG: hypothetical protein IPG07_01945 [Crocinitomicaceae bacterium]|jgi:hypothetical protein|nr:hypothetical protein [Crocinitomicaceae bacterium]